MAEDGPLSDHYPLKETPSSEYGQRTEWNVRDSDGTLIAAFGQPTGGTAYTIEVARRLGKPYVVVDLEKRATPEDAVVEIVSWIETHSIRVLNVAGPSGSKQPQVHNRVLEIIRTLLKPASS